MHHVHTLPLVIAIAMDDQDPGPPNPSASTAAVLLQLHDRDFLSSSFAKERLSNSFAFDSFVRNQASVRETKKKKKKKTQVDFSRGVRSQPSNYAVYAPGTNRVSLYDVFVRACVRACVRVCVCVWVWVCVCVSIQLPKRQVVFARTCSLYVGVLNTSAFRDAMCILGQYDLASRSCQWRSWWGCLCGV